MNFFFPLSLLAFWLLECSTHKVSIAEEKLLGCQNCDMFLVIPKEWMNCVMQVFIVGLESYQIQRVLRAIRDSLHNKQKQL